MKRKLIYLFIAFAAAILPAHAQKFLNDALTLSNVSLWQQGNSLYVGMTFDMKNLTIGSARSLSLIPLLTDGQHNVPLQEIIVNGKRREKAYIRGLAITKQEPTAIIVPYNKRETFNYTQVIPYKPWMANASLQLVENLCGNERAGTDNERCIYRSQTFKCHVSYHCLYSANRRSGQKP